MLSDRIRANIEAAPWVVDEVKALELKRKEIRSELIRIAALLATCYNLPSDLVDDYPQKTYSAARVAGMMAKVHDQAKMMAYQLRQVADSIKA